MYNKRLAIIGTGYVGLVQGICMADSGLKVINVDKDETKVEALKQGKVPIYEPGLLERFERVLKRGAIEFTTDIKYAIEAAEVIFTAVGTPQNQDWTADLENVFIVAREIGQYMNDYKLIVTKSTVPVGTGRKLKAVIQEELDKRGVNYEFDVASNPEFLREGRAVQDFTVPDRIVIGSDSPRAIDILTSIYHPSDRNRIPLVITGIESAELIKYASNAFLATKISYINEIANLCEKVGADVYEVARGMGMDGRIGSKFLHPGPGYGGSCFPKDTRALVATAQEYGETMSIVETVINSNENQKQRVVSRVSKTMGDLSGKTLGILGLTFKAETDDIRDSCSLVIIPELIKLGASIKAYDPEGIPNFKAQMKTYDKDIVYCYDAHEATKQADGIVILTEWSEFRQLDMDELKEVMKDKYIFDCRNLFEPETANRNGFIHYGIGRNIL